MTFNLGSSQSYTSNGSISGGGGITKSGSGHLYLWGSNNYSGGTTVSGGILEGNTTSLQGTITNNAEVRFNQSGNGTYSGTMGGNGLLRKQGSGQVTFSAANTYTGQTVVEAGTLILNSSANSKGNATINSGATLQMGTANAFNTSSDVTANGTFNLNGNSQHIGDLTGSGAVSLGSGTLTLGTSTNATFSGTVSGTGGVTKEGSGTAILSNSANSYLGLTTVNTGVLELAGANLGSATINNTATLKMLNVNVYNSVNSDINNDSIFNLDSLNQTIGDLTGTDASAVVQLGSATLTLGHNSTVSYAGTITGPGNIVKNNSGTQTLSNSSNSYTGTTTVNAGTLNLFGTNLGHLVVTGGTLNFTGTSTGNVTVSGGTLNILSANILTVPGTLTVNNPGTFALNGNNQSVAELTGSGSITLGGATLTIGVGATGTYTWSGDISGGGAVVKSGTGTSIFSGANTYNGGTDVASGILRMGAINSLPLSLAVNVDATLDLAGYN